MGGWPTGMLGKSGSVEIQASIGTNQTNTQATHRRGTSRIRSTAIASRTRPPSANPQAAKKASK
jgi:hypothetical protein